VAAAQRHTASRDHLRSGPTFNPSPAGRRLADRQPEDPGLIEATSTGRTSPILLEQTRDSRHERMSSGNSRLHTPIAEYARLIPPLHVIMNGMAYCDLCEMDREFCEHGLADRRRNAAATASGLLISPSGIAHFAGCPHKGDHPDYSRWGALDAPSAWERLGNGAQLRATGGRSLRLTATDRCKDCVSHGPW
jgi:hypothetical protein